MVVEVLTKSPMAFEKFKGSPNILKIGTRATAEPTPLSEKSVEKISVMKK
jgi:hypothetical protein